MPDVVYLDPAVDLQPDVAARGINARAHVAQLVQRRVDKALTAKARVDRHDQHEVQAIHDVVEDLRRRGRVEYQTGFAAVATNELQAAIHMLAGFRVKADPAGAGLGKLTNQRINRRTHQVHINGGRDAVVAQGLTNRRAKRQVGHVVIVHDIEMHDVGAGIEHGLNILTQTGEVGGENRRRDQRRLAHGTVT